MRGTAVSHLQNQPKGKQQETEVQKAVETSPASRQSTYSEDGVDLTLIRWMLSLSPAERLQILQENVRAILRLRREDTKLPFDTSDAPNTED
jgi:hypothetical protein